MERQLGHMVRLIDELLDISRVTSGKLQLHCERVELATAVQSAVEATRTVIEASAHELTVTLPGESVFLNADPTRLAQIISNLLNNAAKYTEKGGHIWLSAQRQNGSVAISIRDTGIGLAKEHLSQIFEMFSQVTPALERSQGGLGIGLALVRGLAELHHGTIEAHSNGPGLGSEFIVRLPVLDVGTPGPAAASEAKAGLGSKCRILVVDDNIDSAQSLALLLGRMGHEIEVAHDGLEAVQAAGAFRPQIVLLDIGLPRMNGYEAARRIRAQSGGDKVAIIALTGWGQEKDKQLAAEAGFDHHLTKPVEPATLTSLLAVLAPS
jgi:CheY-like chemotaxis protein